MWQILIIAQIVVSSIMTILTRKLSLANQRAFYAVGFISYLMVALMGIIYSFVFGVPAGYLPSAEAWQFILPAAIGIVTSWLLVYRIIAIFGASNAVLITAANHFGTALLGYAILGEQLSSTFLVGVVLMLASIWLAFTVGSATSSRRTNTKLGTKILLLVGMVVAYSFGMMFEKLAIDSIGVWEYARFGWSMQFVAALVFLAAAGRHEIASIDKSTLKNAALLGLVTSVAGGLFILALSLGTLSGTMLATTAKITLTSVLSYIILHERNALALRIVALALVLGGLWFIL